MQEKFDIVVVGGGLVGSSLVCALARTPVRTAVIEASEPRPESGRAYDDRVLAIAYGSKIILSTIGVWDEIDELDRTPIKSIHISDRGHFGGTHLSHCKHGVDALGYAVAARELGAALAQRVAQHTSASVVRPARVVSVEVEEEFAVLKVEKGSQTSELIARLVVFADGADSGLRNSLGFVTERHGYGQSAIVTTVTPMHAHQGVAYERFTDTGPMAFLPSRDNRYTVVWTTADQQVDELMRCPEEDFLARLQARFGDRAGRLQRLGRRSVYPLSSSQVRKPVQQRLVIVGNAAHTVHPVAGQGFNLGLRDVSTIAEVLHDACSQGVDIGSTAVLEHYWQQRKSDTRRVGMFTDGLIRLFANDHYSTTVIRNMVLVGLDFLPVAQRMLVRRTMGLAGRLPRLSRGVSLD